MKTLSKIISESKASEKEVADAAMACIRNAKEGYGAIFADEDEVNGVIELAKAKLTKTKTPGKSYVVIFWNSQTGLGGIEFTDTTTRFNKSKFGVDKHGVCLYSDYGHGVSYSLDFLEDRANPNSLNHKMDKYEFYKFDAALVRPIWDAYASRCE